MSHRISASARPVVGLVGVGRMGGPVCARLARGGHVVVASDTEPRCERAARSAGARWAATTAEAAAAADVLVTVLPGTAELRDAMGAALPVLRSGATWIDMTSAEPVAGAELGAQARARGIECLDAPLGGGLDAAGAGTLQLFVGGDAATVARHRELLEALGTIDHVGGHGAGHTTKLLANLLWFGQAVATGEALLLARRAGLDIAAVRGALERSAAATEFIRSDLDALLAGDDLASFGLDRCCEELRAVEDLATAHGTPFELSAQVRRAYERALERYGAVDGELLAVRLLEERAGVTLGAPVSEPRGRPPSRRP